jgi:hypothetical protein
LERLKDALDVFFQILDFSGHRPHRLGLVGWQMGQVLGSLGVVHLCSQVRMRTLSGIQQHGELVVLPAYCQVLRTSQGEGREVNQSLTFSTPPFDRDHEPGLKLWLLYG